MHYAFFGTPKFAAIILGKLIKAGTPPALVVCNPDKPVGRRQVITPPPAKVVAEKHKIEVLQPDDLKIENFKLKIAGMDFAVVAAYAKILPNEILKLPRLGMVGVHPSLLPKYRGTTPIQSAILAGEAETGTTLFLLDEQVDHGAILAQRVTAIVNRDTYETLMEKLADVSGDLLAEILPKFAAGSVDPLTQNEAEATFTKKFKSADGFVDIAKEDPGTLARKIRALNPEPGVYTVIGGKRIKMLDAETIQYEGKKPRNVGNAISYLTSL